MGERSETTPRKKRQITEAAAELFRRHGIRRVTVTEICETAAVSKMTFYKYFRNKVEVAKHVVDSLSDAVLEELEDIRGRDLPFPTKARLWIESGVRLANELSPAFVEELYDAQPELRGFLRDRSRQNLDRFAEFLAEAQGRGEVRRDIAPELMLLVAERLNGLGREERALAIYPSYAELTRAVRTLFFYGIMGKEG